VPELPPSELTALLRAELDAPVPGPVPRMAEAIRDRHRGVAAILFYGSCLRRGTLEGVLDFYVLVDGYRAAHRSLVQAALGWLLPPNVFYLEIPADGAGGPPLRAKYAVISTRHFLRAARGRRLDCRIWSRFCQPARLVHARDAEARAAAEKAVLSATLTAVDRMINWLPTLGALQRFAPGALWTTAFRETYRAELRGEKAETIDAIYDAQRERFDRVARAALRVLEGRGRLRVREVGDELEVEADPAWRASARRAWRVRRPLAKALAIAGLVKTPLTFDGWVDYAVWKVERHSGVRIELSDRQRRRPLLHAGPILVRLWRERALR
jgi:hypothetical protein